MSDPLFAWRKSHRHKGWVYVGRCAKWLHHYGWVYFGPRAMGWWWRNATAKLRPREPSP